jgi:hypothetical protein
MGITQGADDQEVVCHALGIAHLVKVGSAAWSRHYLHCLSYGQELMSEFDGFLL